ncbi:MAG: type 2 isopentenyl-diphosphate Delta-isomerase [Nanoarchaeota archaeon]|nr:type 2 isopentenyl-diphosphate Delta-isomerase [Nanoarchaeota archaeon]MBU4299944.1 type 2 isopentenyl-diphosphate Delta-isomerase [Nanoarchaeota archaeon]MBU4451307.1 type 2 isopentenyl-diphosphate Delta-isomerase [Nanoarchaeota archaeon]MCG2723678.1 type 2 isopentenyl-diphosphate Delta-isomerase [archaeon]
MAYKIQKKAEEKKEAPKKPIEQRKSDHITLCLSKEAESSKTGFEDIRLIHKSLPEINFEEVDISTTFLGKKLNAPIIIEAITGGCEEAEKINKNLAKAAERVGVAFGVGSERAFMTAPQLAETYKIRDVAPNVFLIGNLGLIQFRNGFGDREFNQAICEIDCNALAIHLNPLQELCQPEGDKNWKGCTNELAEMCKAGFPIIVKETGAGISAEVAKSIERAGAKAIDVSGLGGTNFALIESYRNGVSGFENWGIPTACSIIEVRGAVRIPIIASGGIRSGVDMAKSIALGADMCGAALPFLRAAVISDIAVEEKLREFIMQLKIAMILTGCKNIAELKKTKYIISGFVKEWKEQRVR